MDSPVDISIIIVSYNTYELTKQAVASTLESGCKLAYEIIVIDNASPDDSATLLENDFANVHNVHIIPSDRNSGFAAANNTGARSSTGDVLFFLNSDTIVKPGAIDALYNFTSSDLSNGAVGPHVLNEDGSDQLSISSFPSFRSMFAHYLPIKALFNRGLTKTVHLPEDKESVDVVKGCALAMNRVAFDHVGGWDESYFLYSEETELCKQLVDTGFTNRFISSSKIIHFGGASTSQDDFSKQQIVQQRSAVQFLQRHGRPGLVATNRVLGTLGFGTRWIVFRTGLLFSSNLNFEKRAAASKALFRWFLNDYNT